MISIGGYTFGVDDKCALFLRINDWQNDLAKHAPPAGGNREQVEKQEHRSVRGPGRPRKDASKGLEAMPEGMETINHGATSWRAEKTGFVGV
jgi:hypothetical protein